jgi:hypothetical protein
MACVIQNLVLVLIVMNIRMTLMEVGVIVVVMELLEVFIIIIIIIIIYYICFMLGCFYDDNDGNGDSECYSKADAYTGCNGYSGNPSACNSEKNGIFGGI